MIYGIMKLTGPNGFKMTDRIILKGTDTMPASHERWVGAMNGERMFAKYKLVKDHGGGFGEYKATHKRIGNGEWEKVQ